MTARKVVIDICWYYSERGIQICIELASLLLIFKHCWNSIGAYKFPFLLSSRRSKMGNSREIALCDGVEEGDKRSESEEGENAWEGWWWFIYWLLFQDFCLIPCKFYGKVRNRNSTIPMSSIILLLSMHVDEIMGEELIGGRDSERLIIHATLIFHMYSNGHKYSCSKDHRLNWPGTVPLRIISTGLTSISAVTCNTSSNVWRMKRLVNIIFLGFAARSLLKFSQSHPVSRICETYLFLVWIQQRMENARWDRR